MQIVICKSNERTFLQSSISCRHLSAHSLERAILHAIHLPQGTSAGPNCSGLTHTMIKTPALLGGGLSLEPDSAAAYAVAPNPLSRLLHTGTRAISALMILSLPSFHFLSPLLQEGVARLNCSINAPIKLFAYSVTPSPNPK